MFAIFITFVILLPVISAWFNMQADLKVARALHDADAAAYLAKQEAEQK